MMDIQQMLAPTPVKQPASDKAVKVDESTEGQVESVDFSKLLQGMQGADVSLLDAGTDAVPAVEGLPLIPLDASLSFSFESDAAMPLGQDAVAPLVLDVGSLLGQTQRLDAAVVDVVEQTKRMDIAGSDADGLSDSLVFAKPDAGLGAQLHVAVGQQLATVAAGVQPLGVTVLPAGSVGALAVASAVLVDVLPVAETVVETVNSWKTEQDSEGRLVLQGAWKLEDPATTPPVLNRLIGQIEQWAVATVGVLPKSSERVETAKSAANAADWLAAGQGSGTRLTDVAVKETQAAQDAVLDAQMDAPVEDMRFWVQGKQQRAEVVLEKDGQPVRVQVTVRGSEVHVMFHADQLQTRELLDASLEQLRAMLEQQGVQLAGVSVQAEAQGNTSDDGARNPWNIEVAQHAQVIVPLAETSEVRVQRNQGVDFYA